MVLKVGFQAGFLNNSDDRFCATKTHGEFQWEMSPFIEHVRNISDSTGSGVL
jgi:hypothetical protein